MGEFRNRSGLIPFVSLRPSVIGAAYTDRTPFRLLIALEFSEPMNVLLTPGDINVEFVHGGGPIWLDFDQWNDDTHAQYTLILPGAPGAATVQLKVDDPMLEDMTGYMCYTSIQFPIA